MIIRRDTASTAPSTTRPAAVAHDERGRDDIHGHGDTTHVEREASDLMASSEEKCDETGIYESGADMRFFAAFSYLVFMVAMIREYASPCYPPYMYIYMVFAIGGSANLIYALVWRDIQYWGRKQLKKASSLRSG
jgi:hypothetical protein